MHDLSGHCLSCAKLFNRYPGFNTELRTWFEAIQIENQEMHISCAGRGKIEQEMLFSRGATRAHWLQSAHNFNLACDIFELRDGIYTLDKDWFQRVIFPNLYPGLNWLGKPGSTFYELPHIEISNFRDLVSSGKALPVE